jgi:hypothetical protein
MASSLTRECTAADLATYAEFSSMRGTDLRQMLPAEPPAACFAAAATARARFDAVRMY